MHLLHIALSRPSNLKSHRYTVMKMVLDAGANINAQDTKVKKLFQQQLKLILEKIISEM